MIISGLQKTSFIDYPEKISAILFTRGCNFKCPYCHNPELVDPERYYPEISEREVLGFLEKRQDVLDGIVITGGEPTIYQDLPALIKKIKQFGYLVKLDTNGTNFMMLKELIEQNLIDYVAMDIKHHPQRYQEIAGIDVEDVKKSVEYLIASDLPNEFRTTVLPRYFGAEDFGKLGEFIKVTKTNKYQNLPLDK